MIRICVITFLMTNPRTAQDNHVKTTLRKYLALNNFLFFKSVKSTLKKILIGPLLNYLFLTKRK